jgi:hypothetical protein
MIKNIEAQKTDLKEKIGKEIDEYFAVFESSSNEKGFDINKIEQLMLENHRKLTRTLEEANSELSSSVEMGVKKTVQSVERE